MPSYHGDTLSLESIDTPSAPTLTVRGTAGESSYGYKVVALKGDGHTAASSEATTSSGASSLTGNNRIDVKPPYVAGASKFDVYRTSGGATQGKIGSVTPRNVGTNQMAILRDTGQTAAEGAAPTTNTTGSLVLGAILMASNLPIEDPLVEGQVWNDSGVLTVSTGA